MRWWRHLIRILISPLRRENEEALDEELQFHIDMETRSLIEQGVEPAQARRLASAAFGRVDRVKEDVRDVRPIARFLDETRRDFRLATRTLIQQPGFMVVASCTLALGIGGNLAILGVIDTALLRSLSFPDPHSLVVGRVTYGGEIGTSVSGPDYFDIREQASTLEGLAAYTHFSLQATWAGASAATQIRAPVVSHNFLRVLGVDPTVGRDFLPEEGEPGSAAVVLLAYDFWHRSFGADEGVVGTTLIIDGAPHEVVGVAPPEVASVLRADVFRTLRRSEGWASARQFHNFLLIGRLRAGTSIEVAQSQVDLISSRLAAAYPETNADKGVHLTDLRAALVEDYRRPLLLLAGSVVLLLFVACANVAGLLLVRSERRRAEMAVRSVLGASGWRLARQLLTEDFLIASMGAALGLVLALALHSGLLSFLGIESVRSEGVLSPVLSYGAMALALIALALFGFGPALRSARSSARPHLGSGARATGGRGGGRLPSALLVGQVAMTTVLLIVAGLLLRSFGELSRVDTGFDSEDLLTAEISLPPGEYEDLSRRAEFFERFRERARELPRVRGVGLINRLPIRDGGANVRVAEPQHWGTGGVFERIAYQRMVLPGYFEAMSIPLLSGRDFTLRDDRDAPAVLMISSSLAQELFAEANPLGRVLGVDVGSEEPWTAEVVGVVADVVPTSLAAGADHVMYFSYRQRSPASMRFALRSRAEPRALLTSLQEVVADLDPGVPIAAPMLMEDILERSIAPRSALMTTLGTFAFVALLLCAVGLYGLLSYMVSMRKRELGIRMALGASMATVVWGVLRRGLSLVGLGLLASTPLVAASANSVGQHLFSIGALDAPTYLAAATFLTVVGLMACALPARRAASIDPSVAFRQD